MYTQKNSLELHHQFINNLISIFPEDLENKLRKYLEKKDIKLERFSRLPEQQIFTAEFTEIELIQNPIFKISFALVLRIACNNFSFGMPS